MHSVNITNYTQNECVCTYILHAYIHMNIFCAWVKIFQGYEQSIMAILDYHTSKYEEDTYGWFFKVFV